jgi:hypothetical protein
MDLKSQIKQALGLEEESVKLGFQAKTEDGTIIVSTAEELESGVDISVLTEDGTTILLPVGTYKLDTGVSFRVEEEGIVAEVIESETEEEDTVEEEDLAVDDGKEADVDDWAGMEKRIQNLEDAVADIKRMMGEGDDVEEMSEETPEATTEEAGENPKTVTTKTTEVVEFSAEEELEKLKAENEKLKTELAEQPAAAPLDTNKFSADNKKTYTKQEFSKLSRRERILYGITNN